MGTATAFKKKATVPLYVLQGFLGSGKTTLLGELIGASLRQGRTPGLLINEFRECLY